MHYLQDPMYIPDNVKRLVVLEVEGKAMIICDSHQIW